ncbi:CCL3 protein, partial [Chaetops frenatus]|nr:CCL3 protein [Chaetops frenatus]
MRVLAATLAVLLLVATCSLAETDLRDSSIAALSQKQEPILTSCCFSYILRRLPRKTIRSAYRTSTSCSMPAVVLVTTKGKELCADPKARWVQNYLEHLELQEH